MVKKQKFTKEIRGLDALFSDQPDSEKEVHNTKNVIRSKGRNEKKHPLEKISFNLEAPLSEKIKAYAYEKRIPLTRLMETCVEDFVSNLSKDEIESALQTYRSAKN